SYHLGRDAEKAQDCEAVAYYYSCAGYAYHFLFQGSEPRGRKSADGIQQTKNAPEASSSPLPWRGEGSKRCSPRACCPAPANCPPRSTRASAWPATCTTTAWPSASGPPRASAGSTRATCCTCPRR